MAEEIITVTGVKGGSGKTKTVLAIADVIRFAMGWKLLAIDSDTGNPGFAKTYDPVAKAHPDDGLVVAPLDLSSVEAWSGLLDFCDDMPNYRVLIDTPAGSHKSFERYAKVLHGSLADLQRKWSSVFVLGSSRDCMELLEDYIEMMPQDHVIHVVCNHHHGERRSVWASYLDSEVSKEIERRGGKTLVLPALAGGIMQAIDENRLTYTGALSAPKDKISFGEKAVLRTWLGEVHAEFKNLFKA